MARPKAPEKPTAFDFSVETFERVARELKSGRLPLVRTQISDDMVTGLRMLINRSGLMSYHVSYYCGDARPYIKIGEANKNSPDYLTLEDARELAKTIKGLAEKGIDVQEGLMQRLIRELKRDGMKWRPQ